MIHHESERERPQGDAPSLRIVIGYPYHQCGSTKHWDRRQADVRPAALVEHSTPLGPRLAENDEKIVWIEVHTEIGPAEVRDDVADHYESAADSEFRKHRPGHIVLARACSAASTQ
jgi:hypothetical protein